MIISIPRINFALLAVASWAVALVESQTTVSGAIASIDRLAAELINNQGLPSIAVAAVANTDQGFQTWTAGYGYANVEENIPATPDTNYWMASVTKTILGTLIMRAEEQGKLTLDSTATGILADNEIPLALGNQGRLDNITFEHLATHTALIRDSEYYSCSYYLSEPDQDNNVTEEVQLLVDLAGIPNNCRSNVSVAPGDWLEEYLSPGGAYYDEVNNFVPDETVLPGDDQEYSNVGAALAGYLLEIVTDSSLPEFSTKELFEPLGMSRSSFLLSDLDATNVAVPYFPVDENETIPLPYYDLATRPDGGLRSTANDMAKFLGVVMNDGSLGDSNGDGSEEVTILQPSSVKNMLRPRFGSDIGVFWTTGNQQFADGSLRSLVGHTGGDPGAVSFLFFDPARYTGAFIVSNGDSDLPNVDVETVYELLLALFDRGEEMQMESKNDTSDVPSSASAPTAPLGMVVAMFAIGVFL